MSIFSSLFGGGNQTQAAQAAPTPPGNIPVNQPQSMQAAPGNINAPAASTPADNSQQPTQAPEGLDKFNDLWQPVQSSTEGQNGQLFNMDPKQVMDAAKKIDFSKVIQPEQLQAISSGGQEAVNAFAQAMNAVAQTVYAQNTHVTAKMVEQAVQKTREQVLSELPQHIKRQNVSETLRADNPALSHPAAAPIIGALEQQLTMKFPNASSVEIKNMAVDYLSNFAGSFNKPSKQAQGQQTGKADTDWDLFLA